MAAHVKTPILFKVTMKLLHDPQICHMWIPLCVFETPFTSSGGEGWTWGMLLSLLSFTAMADKLEAVHNHANKTTTRN